MAKDLISEERFLYTKANQIGKTKDEIEYFISQASANDFV